jgi:transcriptional regulator with XRE-family HTH domain
VDGAGTAVEPRGPAQRPVTYRARAVAEELLRLSCRCYDPQRNTIVEPRAAVRAEHFADASRYGLSEIRCNVERKPLGAYLRARRSLVNPLDIGIPADGRRRVPGLRREEVAVLAGISTDYYTRLEQGRNENPSAEVVDALARALWLDENETVHLRKLATRGRPSSQVRPSGNIAPGIRQLVLSRSRTPTMLLNRYMDVLAANDIATSLSPSFREGANLLREVFSRTDVRELFDSDYDLLATELVAGVRALNVPDIGDPYLTMLADDLSTCSEMFRKVWDRHDVSVHNHGEVRVRHPAAGRIHLRYDVFYSMGTDSQALFTYHAEPGSPSDEALHSMMARSGSG